MYGGYHKIEHFVCHRDFFVHKLILFLTNDWLWNEWLMNVVHMFYFMVHPSPVFNVLHEVFLFGKVFLWERFSMSQKFCFGTFFEWYKFSFGTFSESMIGWNWNDSHTLWVTRFSSNHWIGKCAKRKFVSFKKCAKIKFLRNWKSLSQENCAKKKYLVYKAFL